MKKLTKPLIILVVLLGVWAVVEYTGREAGAPDPETTLDVQVNGDQVRRIEIQRGEQNVTLLHGASGGWQVQTDKGLQPAELQAVQSALTSLDEIETTDIVSHNPEKRSEFQVADNEGTRVRIYGEGDALIDELILGRMGGFEGQARAMQQGRIDESQFYTFIRRPGSDNVYKVQGFFGGMLSTETDQWRNHMLMEFMPEQALRVSIAYPEENVVLQRDSNGKWAMMEPEATTSIDSTVVGRMVSSLGVMRASGFVDSVLPPDTLGLQEPGAVIEIGLEGGVQKKVTVGNETGSNLHFCTTGDSDQVYTVARFYLDRVLKRPADIRKQEQ